MTETEARKNWAQYIQEFRQKVKESGLSIDEYCERQRRELEKSKPTLWQRFIRWLGINV